MSYVNLTGVDLWYEDTGGDGIPVILMHAATGTCDCWIYQLPAFTAAGYRCVAYDRRTWGRSRPTDDAAQPGFQGDDLHGLLGHLGIDDCHLVGTAAGGITAIDYALTHPGRVRSLVVANTIAGVQDAEYLEVQNRMRPPPIRDLPEELRELGASYRGTDPEGVARWMEIEHASRPYGRLPAQPVREPITYARLATMSVPTLVISGQADILAPPALMRMLADHIPGSRFATLEDVGHAGFWERPQVWNGLVLEFIGKHD